MRILATSRKSVDAHRGVTMCITLLSVFLLLPVESLSSSTTCTLTTSSDALLLADCAFRRLRSVPTDLPSNLSILTLRGNYIDFQDGDLWRFTQLVRLDVSYNKMPKVTNQTFLGSMSSLTELVLSRNYIESLSPYAFAQMTSLRSLFLECNPLIGFDSVFLALSNLPSALHDLVIDDVQPPDKPLLLTKDTVAKANFSELRRLSMCHERFLIIEVEVLNYLNNVEQIALAYETPLNIRPKDNYETVLADYYRNTKLTLLDASYFFNTFGQGFSQQRCNSHLTSVSDYFEKVPENIIKDTLPVSPQNFDPTGKKPLSLPVSLRYLFFTNWHSVTPFNINNAYFNPNNNIQYLNMTNGYISRISGPIYGLQSLQVIDFSNCGINYISPGSLDVYPNLRYLHLQNNNLGESSFHFQSTFTNLSLLEYLDLSGNGLHTLDKSAFHGLHRLRHLDLSRNLLTTISFDVSGLSHLEMLDLSENEITHVPSNFTESLDRLATTSRVILTINANPFVCECPGTFYRWVSKHINATAGVNLPEVDSYICDNLNVTVLTFVSEVDCTSAGDQVSHMSFMIYTVVAGTMVAIIVVFAIALRLCNKWRFQWIYYSLRLAFIRKPADTGRPRRSYDAFVAHAFRSDTALAWTINTLIPVFEHDWGMKLFVWERDSIGGYAITDNIINAVKSSELTLILVEPDLCEEEWCDFMIQMALMSGRYLIVYLKEVTPCTVTPLVCELMKRKNYLEWPYCRLHDQGREPDNQSFNGGDQSSDSESGYEDSLSGCSQQSEVTLFNMDSISATQQVDSNSCSDLSRSTITEHRHRRSNKDALVRRTRKYQNRLRKLFKSDKTNQEKFFWKSLRARMRQNAVKCSLREDEDTEGSMALLV